MLIEAEIMQFSADESFISDIQITFQTDKNIIKLSVNFRDAARQRLRALNYDS